jgi:hypothetical protein
LREFTKYEILNSESEKQSESGRTDPEGVKPQYENDYTMNYDPEGVKHPYENNELRP